MKVLCVAKSLAQSVQHQQTECAWHRPAAISNEGVKQNDLKAEHLQQDISSALISCLTKRA